MTYVISNNCIACGSCLSQCPTGAISQNDSGQFAIDPNVCNHCVGFYGVPQCMSVCPTKDSCTPSLESVIPATEGEYWDRWFGTYEHLTTRLQAKQETQYWQHWFDVYSEKLERLMVSH
ncbi:MAG: 4Fe-4S binding protein [Halothece sp.]